MKSPKELLEKLVQQADPKRVKKAQKILDKVGEITFDPVRQVYTAEVGSERSTTKKYKVEIALQGDTPHATCTCPDNSKRHQVCKHIVATALNISQNPDAVRKTIPASTIETASGIVYDTFLEDYGKYASDVLIDFLTQTKENILLVGPAGTGKNTLIQAVAFLIDRPVYTIASYEDMNEERLFGTFVADGNGGFKWQDGIVTKAVKNGGILVIDEINARPTLFSLHALLDFRREIYIPILGQSIKAHKNFRVIATMNDGYYGTNELNEALRSRFIEIHLGYDINIDRQILSEYDITGKVADTYLKVLEGLRNSYEKQMIVTPPSYRLTRSFAITYKLYGAEVGVRTLLAKFTEEEREAVQSYLTLLNNIGGQE